MMMIIIIIEILVILRNHLEHTLLKIKANKLHFNPKPNRCTVKTYFPFEIYISSNTVKIRNCIRIHEQHNGN